LSDEEWNKLYQAAKPHLKPVLLVAYHLGQRSGEIVGLTWDRVDLQRGSIALRSVDTKTKKPRQVPLTPAVRLELGNLSKVRSLVTNRVFLYKGLPMQRIHRTFKTAQKDAGIQDFRFHDLRHCASNRYENSGPQVREDVEAV
jgi:integrase